MQVSRVYHSISTAQVSQRPARLAASFQPSIPGTDARASDAPWTGAGVIVVVRAPEKVTQPSWLQSLQAEPARRIRQDV